MIFEKIKIKINKSLPFFTKFWLKYPNFNIFLRNNQENLLFLLIILINL